MQGSGNLLTPGSERDSPTRQSIDDRPTDLSSLLLFAESKDFSRGALFQMSVTIYFQKKSVGSVIWRALSSFRSAARRPPTKFRSRRKCVVVERI